MGHGSSLDAARWTKGIERSAGYLCSHPRQWRDVLEELCDKQAVGLLRCADGKLCSRGESCALMSYRKAAR